MDQVIYTFLIPIAIGFIIALLQDELYAGLEYLTRFLVLKGANHISEACRPRYVEECLAELDHIQGPVSKMWNAIGMYRAAKRGIHFAGDALPATKHEHSNNVADPAAVALYSAEILYELRDMASGAGHTFGAYLIQVAIEEMTIRANTNGDQTTDAQLRLPLDYWFVFNDPNL